MPDVMRLTAEPDANKHCMAVKRENTLLSAPFIYIMLSIVMTIRYSIYTSAHNDTELNDMNLKSRIIKGKTLSFNEPKPKFY